MVCDSLLKWCRGEDLNVHVKGGMSNLVVGFKKSVSTAEILENAVNLW